MINRRDMLRLGAAGLAAEAARLAAQQAAPANGPSPQNGTEAGMQLRDYTPKSMLHVAKTDVPRSRYPVIDWHTHITHGSGLNKGDGISFSATPEDCLPVMDRRNLHTMVDLTGGYGAGLREAIAKLQAPHAGRFVVFTEPAYNLVDDPSYPQRQADLIKDAHNSGAKGLKVLKTLGLVLRDRVTEGPLVKIDDPRFDPMWETVGGLEMPVAIHTSDPEAFFLPTDQNNERWEELYYHPNWSYYNKGTPSNMELQEARRNVMRRHPKTKFVCLHVADSENLPYVSECLDAHPNMYVDIAARISELGRQPRASKKFFDKYQDRIMFGTDASFHSTTPQQEFGDELYQIYFRFLETEDEYFDYTPAAKPAQGRWSIYGVGLPDPVLKKVYWSNAAQLLKMPSNV